MRLLSICISLNRWTIKEKEKKQKRRPITEENTGNIEYNASSQGNDFSLGGDDDEIDVDGCG